MVLEKNIMHIFILEIASIEVGLVQIYIHRMFLMALRIYRSTLYIRAY